LWDLNCSACKQPIDYEELAVELLNLPKVEPRFEAAEVLFVGVERTEIPGAFTSNLSVGPESSQELNGLTLRRVEGGTWGDYLGEAEALSIWLNSVSFGRSRYALVVLDTTSPLSVLAARSPVLRGAPVIAVTANDDSTPMDKSCSYASLSVLATAGCPTLLVTRSYAEALTLYTPREGILRGYGALSHIAGRYTARAEAYSNLFERDKRLGIFVHALSILPTASDRVYRDPAHAVDAAAQIRSVTHSEEEVHSLHLIARAHTRHLRRIEKAYEALRRRFPNLLDSDTTLIESDNGKGLYDIAILYGLRGDPLSPLFRDGYEAVAAKNPQLRLEAAP